MPPADLYFNEGHPVCILGWWHHKYFSIQRIPRRIFGSVFQEKLFLLLQVCMPRQTRHANVLHFLECFWNDFSIEIYQFFWGGWRSCVEERITRPLVSVISPDRTNLKRRPNGLYPRRNIPDLGIYCFTWKPHYFGDYECIAWPARNI